MQCPSCGAGLELRNAASLVIVCGYCGTVSERSGEDLKDVGKAGSLKDEGSPFKLGSTGRIDKKNFRIIGRIQMQYSDGFWNEWYIAFDDGFTAWLSESNGSYVFLSRCEDTVPAFADLKPGRPVLIRNERYFVTDIRSARAVSGEGELPFTFDSSYDADVVDLMNEKSGFASVDYSEDPPFIFTGKSLEYADLAMSNLRPVEGWR